MYCYSEPNVLMHSSRKELPKTLPTNPCIYNWHHIYVIYDPRMYILTSTEFKWALINLKNKKTKQKNLDKIIPDKNK